MTTGFFRFLRKLADSLGSFHFSLKMTSHKTLKCIPCKYTPLAWIQQHEFRSRHPYQISMSSVSRIPVENSTSIPHKLRVAAIRVRRTAGWVSGWQETEIDWIRAGSNGRGRAPAVGGGIRSCENSHYRGKGTSLVLLSSRTDPAQSCPDVPRQVHMHHGPWSRQTHTRGTFTY